MKTKNILTKTNMKKKGHSRGNLRVVGTVSLFAIAILSTFILAQFGQFFQASLLQAEKVKSFDGTVYPIQETPIWTALNASEYKAEYKDISTDKLQSIPTYDPDKLVADASTLRWPADNDIRNAKITYAVAYLGNYEGDGAEDAGSHPAVDIKIPVGTPVYAIANGQVVKAVRSTAGFGNHIVIGHPNVPDPESNKKVVLYSSYSHLSDIVVTDGQVVDKGELIGYSGASGTATTPHLHFQIDTSLAPFFPYWPFTSAEASAAGLNFFSAINAGLGKEKAEEYTVNPMDFVQKYLDSTADYFSGDTSSSDDEDDDEVSETATLEHFEFFYESKQLESGKTVTIAVEAQDKNDYKIEDYNKSLTFKVITTQGVTKIPFSFSKGSAVVTFSVPLEADSLTVSITDDKIETTKNFTVKTEDIAYTYELKFAAPYIRTDDTVKLNIKAKLAGQIDKTYDSITPLVISAPEYLALSKNSLDSSDFYDGVATITVKGLSYGKFNIKLLAGGREFESDSLKVMDSIPPVVSFRIEHDGNFVPGVPEKITIVSLDKDGEPTPVYSIPGTVALTDSPAGGTFTPSELTMSDFNYGVAEVQYKRDDTSAVIIEARQGSLIGSSAAMTAGKSENIFSDVTTDHTNATAIKYLKEHEIIGGYADGSFRPDNVVSRVEALKMILLAFNISLSPSDELEFPDTDSEQWYAPYIGRALNMDVVKGYPDGSFRPSQTVNRAEFLKVLFESTDASVSNIESVSSNPYSDVDTKQWFSGYADYASRKNLVPTENNNLKPSVGMTRADVAEVIYRMLILQATGAEKYQS